MPLPGGVGGATAYVAAANLPKGPTNRDLVRLALRHRCLAGAHLARRQEDALRAILELNDSEREGRPLQVREDREDRDLK